MIDYLYIEKKIENRFLDIFGDSNGLKYIYSQNPKINKTILRMRTFISTSKNRLCYYCKRSSDKKYNNKLYFNYEWATYRQKNVRRKQNFLHFTTYCTKTHKIQLRKIIPDMSICNSCIRDNSFISFPSYCRYNGINAIKARKHISKSLSDRQLEGFVQKSGIFYAPSSMLENIDFTKFKYDKMPLRLNG